MRSIAELTKGRYDFPDDPNKLPTIFFKEARTLKRNLVFKEMSQFNKDSCPRRCEGSSRSRISTAMC